MKRFLFSLFMLTAAFAANAQTADEIIAKNIDAIGGAENWRKINSVIQEGALTIQGAEIPIIQTVLNGKGSRQDITAMGKSGYIIITPTAGWTFLPFQGQQTPEPMTAEDVSQSQSDLDVQGVLIDYAAKGHTVEYLGKDDVEGTECYKIKVNVKGESPQTMFIDTKSNLVIRITTTKKTNGQETEVITNFSNYEKLPEGILVPKSITLPFGELIISKITINGPVDEAIFKN
jgi:outer membrane lipoprotein-sorting protein